MKFPSILPMAFALYLVLSLTSCSTLEEIANPNVLKTVYLGVGHTTKGEHGAESVTMTFQPKVHPPKEGEDDKLIKDDDSLGENKYGQWVGELQLDQIGIDSDHNHARAINIGLRFYFSQRTAFHPYVGMGLSWIDYDREIQEDASTAIYGRIGVDYLLNRSSRLFVDVRGLNAGEGGRDTILSMGYGYSW